MEDNRKCQVCGEAFVESDDVVVCPECGAPHHRECYNSLGECGRKADHGTDKQYDLENKNVAENEDKPKIIRCGNCGTEIHDPNPQFCPHCGKHFAKIIRINKENGELPFEEAEGNVFSQIFANAFGGVNPEEKIENITVKEAAAFVAVSTNRYIPKFVSLNEKKKISWNWAAFLFPTAWCFFRKMHKDGIIYLVLHIIGCLCLLPMMNFVFASLGGIDISSLPYDKLMEIVMSNMDSFNFLAALSYMIGLGVFALKHVFAGLTADWNYRKNVIEKINQIKSDNETDDEEKRFLFLKKGGVNLFLCMLGIAAENYMLSILMIFLN